MKIFSKEAHQQQYEKDGYITTDLLSSKEVKTLMNFWKKSPHHFDDGKFTSVHQWSPELNAELSKLMHQLTQPHIDEIMPGWIGDGVSFIVKGPRSAKPSDFKLHQDFNMLDESVVPSFGLWIALVDIHQSNGGLFVLPGSHNKFKGTIRSANHPSLHMDIVPEIIPHLKHINIKAGQACIFAHSLFHGSPSNGTKHERAILHMGLFPKEAKSYHYYKTTNNAGKEVFEILEIDREYYYTQILNFIANPKGSPHQAAGILENYRPTPTPKEVLVAYENEPPVIQDEPAKTSWLSTQLKKIYS
jgi:hypothetical protein